MKLKCFVIAVFSACLLASCYKKSEVVPNLNDKIIDHDYNRGKWFEFSYFKIIDPPGAAPEYLRIVFNVKKGYHDNYDCYTRLYGPNNDTITSKYYGKITYNTSDFSVGTPRLFKIGIKDKHSQDVINVFEETVIYPG